MKPEMEILEGRDTPSGTPLIAGYPIAPKGMEVVAQQDVVNNLPLIPGSGYFHTTQLMPAPQFLLALPGPVNWQIDPQTGQTLAYIPKDQWLQLQNTMYVVGTDPSTLGIWGPQVAGWQAQVKAWDQYLFAAQDAYWNSQSPASQPVTTITRSGQPVTISYDISAFDLLTQKDQGASA